jgi:hypothetical protein
MPGLEGKSYATTVSYEVPCIGEILGRDSKSTSNDNLVRYIYGMGS